ncbi:MAG: RNase J family beta-CASP ribonuclease [Candidatus Moranbacteria bacterium]|nr:RNase J family beta-CASP ribonuclease [Candidatus Moranbacteria bacterium]
MNSLRNNNNKSPQGHADKSRASASQGMTHQQRLREEARRRQQSQFVAHAAKQNQNRKEQKVYKKDTPRPAQVHKKDVTHPPHKVGSVAPVQNTHNKPKKNNGPRPQGQKSSRPPRAGGNRRRMGGTPKEILVGENGKRGPQKSKVLAIGQKTLRIIPIGGQEEVGRNMTVFEYGNDIVIIDIGMQFPEEDMPGIDYIIPNISYLKGKEKNIRGVIFTHGHLDHIGAAPIILDQLGHPPIIARDLTLALLKRKMEDYQPGGADRLKIIRVGSLDQKIRLGEFVAEFFDVDHSIMDAMGISLSSPAGTVLHLGDWTISHDPLSIERISYEKLADKTRPTILMLESLGAIHKGPPMSEKKVQKNLEDIISNAPGRVVIGTFSSQVKRVGYILNYAERIGKKVVLDGYSMRTNIEVAKELGYIHAKKETVIPINDIHKYPDNKVVVICTGAQGEANAVLSRIVNDAHRFITLKRQDTIVFSSSVIPGNERSIQRLKDNLYRKCDNVIHKDIMDIHVGGHSTAEDIKEVINQIKPDYFLPVYANHFFLKESAKLAYKVGIPEKNTFVLDNGHVLEVEVGKTPHILKHKVDTSYVFIDGIGVGDVGQIVLRDRQMLAGDGMFVITVLIDGKTKEIVGNMHITSRGFIYVKENFDVVNETKRRVRDAVKKTTSKSTSIDWRLVEKSIRETVGQFLFEKTQRRPMVLPVVIEV